MKGVDVEGLHVSTITSFGKRKDFISLAADANFNQKSECRSLEVFPDVMPRLEPMGEDVDRGSRRRSQGGEIAMAREDRGVAEGGRDVSKCGASRKESQFGKKSVGSAIIN